MLAKNIRKLRKSKGYSEVLIADFLEVSVSTYQDYENEKQSIPIPKIEQLALLYNIKPYDLYNEDPKEREYLKMFAFMTDSKPMVSDLKTISAFKKIIINHNNLQSLINKEQKISMEKRTDKKGMR